MFITSGGGKMVVPLSFTFGEASLVSGKLVSNRFLSIAVFVNSELIRYFE